MSTIARSASQKTKPIKTVGRKASTRSKADASSGWNLQVPAFVWLVHTVIVQFFATLAHTFGTLNALSSPFGGQLKAPADLTGLLGDVTGPLRLWDGLWYKLIAAGSAGYPESTITLRPGYGSAEATAAFWPLFPWLQQYGNKFTGAPFEMVGYIVSNLAFLGALVLLYRLVSIDFSETVARTTIWALALFPTALFFTALYTESLFLLLAVGALLSARLGHWWVAGIVGLLAALTRSQGVMLLAPFAVLYFNQYRSDRRGWFPAIIPAMLPLLGPVIFGYMLNNALGNWRAFIDVQNQWNRTSATPVETFDCAIRGCKLVLTQYGKTNTWNVQGADWGWIGDFFSRPTWSTVTSNEWRKRVADSDTLELASTILFLGLGVIALAKAPFYYAAYIWPPLIIPLFSPSTVHPLMSMPRFGITLFPLFVIIALLAQGRRFALPLAIASGILLVLLTMQFSSWYWVS